MNKLYSVHDHWTNINKKNDVDIESIDGVITGIKVNGEDYGGGEWQNIFDNTITTVSAPDGFYTTNIGVVIEADSIRVTFDGVEYNCPKRRFSETSTNFYGALTPLESGEEDFDWSEFPFSIATVPDGVSMSVTTQTAGTHTLKIDIPQSGGGESDLIWILPEQTATLVDQPVEITGLRLDLLPQGVDIMPFKCTTENMGHLHTYYVTLHYDGSALVEDNGTFSIYPQDGSYYFVNADEGTIIKGEYTISIALF